MSLAIGIGGGNPTSGGGGGIQSVSLALSDTTPDFGDTITLTATATDFQSGDDLTYQFIVPDNVGNWQKITQVNDNTYDYVVSLGGTYMVCVIVEDESGGSASDCVEVVATTIYTKHGIDHAWNAENATLIGGLVDELTDVGDTGGQDATAPAAANRLRFLQDPRASTNGSFRSITSDYLSTTLSTVQDNITIAAVFDWSQAQDGAGSYMVFMGGTQTTLDVGSRFNIGYLFSTSKMRFAVRQNSGGVGCSVQFDVVEGKNIFVLTYDQSTGVLRVNMNGSTATDTLSGTVWTNTSNFVLLNGDGSLNYGVGWREPTSECMIGLSTLSDADADQLYADLLVKYPA